MLFLCERERDLVVIGSQMDCSKALKTTSRFEIFFKKKKCLKQIENTRRKSPWLMYWSRCKQGNWASHTAKLRYIRIYPLSQNSDTETHDTLILECINDRSFSTKRLARGIFGRANKWKHIKELSQQNSDQIFLSFC